MRRERQRILVVTEGAVTEPQYFERLQQHLRSGTTFVAVKTVGVGKDPLAVVKKCTELRDAAARADRAYDRCVCVVDVDQHGALPQAVREAANSRIDIVVSNLKFEVWLLWHVSGSRAVLSSVELDRSVAKHGLLAGKHLDPRFPIERVDDAVRTAYLAHPELAAGVVGPDPSSAVPVLVDLMRGGDSPGA